MDSNSARLPSPTGWARLAPLALRCFGVDQPFTASDILADTARSTALDKALGSFCPLATPAALTVALRSACGRPMSSGLVLTAPAELAGMRFIFRRAQLSPAEVELATYMGAAI